MDNNTDPPHMGARAHMSHLTYWQRVRAILASSRTPTERLILIAIADHLGDDGRCWPSSSRIASMVGMKRETVSRNISRLTVAGVLIAERRVGTSSVYRIAWGELSGCDAESHPPVILDHTPCDPESHPPVTQDHTPCDFGSHKDKKEDKNIEDKKEDTPRKRGRSRSRSLSLDEVKAIAPPDDLAAVEGYREAFDRWCEVRPGTGWRRTASQVAAFHAKMLKAWRDGLDVLAALDAAHLAGWQGIRPQWMKPRATSPSSASTTTADAPTDAASAAWATVGEALLKMGAAPPWLDDGWFFSGDPAIDAAYRAGVLAAAEVTTGDTAAAWARLYHDGSTESQLWQGRRFVRAYRASMRGAA